MSNFIDRTGQKFNKLTITKELGKCRVLATCDCGSGEKEYVKHHVTHGKTKNCGCDRTYTIRSRVGEKFGKLEITKELGEGRVIARCDCGVVKEYNKGCIVLGHTKTCGCSKPWVDTVGVLFGSLLVTEELGGGKVLAQCGHGNILEYEKGKLISGKVKGCSCEWINARIDRLK